MKRCPVFCGVLLVAAIMNSSLWAADRAVGLTEAQAKARAAQLTHTAFRGTHVYPELDRPLSPGFYGIELHWDQVVEGNQVAAFLQIDKLNGNVFQVSGVVCYQYGSDKKMHEVHPHGKSRMPGVCM